MNTTVDTAPQTSHTSRMAIVSMVLGLMSFLVSIITGLPAILLGIISLTRINNSRGALRGRGLAITGIVTGGVTTLMVPILVALMLPAVQAAREAASMSTSMNNLKMITLSMWNSQSQYGTLPAAGGDASGLSWRVHMLPYIAENELYDQFNLDEPWDSEHNRALIAKMPDVYRAPGGRQEIPPGKTVYLAVTGPGAMFQGAPGPSLGDITDGSSNTIMLVEADADQAVEWTRPDDWQFDPQDPLRGLGGFRYNSFVAVMADGSVQRIPVDVNPDTLRALFTRDANDVVGAF